MKSLVVGLFLQALLMASIAAASGYYVEHHVPSECISAADPVKEYAMNRLCQIGTAECIRLAHAAIKAEQTR